MSLIKFVKKKLLKVRDCSISYENSISRIFLILSISNFTIFFSTKGVAIIRPPGHHAEADEACGFCIFNNVPVAGMHLFCSKKFVSTLLRNFNGYFPTKYKLSSLCLFFMLYVNYNVQCKSRPYAPNSLELMLLLSPKIETFNLLFN